MSDIRLTWNDYVTKYEEASDLENELQGDVSAIESGSLAQIEQGWYDLTSAIENNPTWADLLKPASAATAELKSVTNAAAAYLQNITLRVQDPNNPGQYIDLYEGTSSVDSNGHIQENYQGNSSNGSGATLYDVVTGECGSLFTNSSSCYYDKGSNINANWASGGLQFNTQGKYELVPTGYNPHDGERTYTSELVGYNCSACGTASQWASYLNLSQGNDPTALNNALFQG